MMLCRGESTHITVCVRESVAEEKLLFHKILSCIYPLSFVIHFTVDMCITTDPRSH